MLCALEAARQILRECYPMGRVDERITVDPLIVVLDQDDLIQALDSINGGRQADFRFSPKKGHRRACV